MGRIEKVFISSISQDKNSNFTQSLPRINENEE